jgi:seryl-tRNA synthetase
MVLDINLFRAEKDGNPDLIKKSQRDRYKNVELVDQVIDFDEQWRKGKYFSSISYVLI